MSWILQGLKKKKKNLRMARHAMHPLHSYHRSSICALPCMGRSSSQSRKQIIAHKEEACGSFEVVENVVRCTSNTITLLETKVPQIIVYRNPNYHSCTEPTSITSQVVYGAVKSMGAKAGLPSLPCSAPFPTCVAEYG